MKTQSLAEPLKIGPPGSFWPSEAAPGLNCFLRELHAKGWSFEQLAEQMKAMGCPVKASVLRDQLGKSVKRTKPRGKSAASVE